MDSPPCRAAFGFQGRAMGDTVQPGGHGVALANGCTIACQHEKGRLKGIFGVLLMVQHSAADAQHHWTVAWDKRGERRLVASGGEVIQQLAVGSLCGAAARRELED